MTRRYEGGSPVSHASFRITSRGVYRCGKPKGAMPVSAGKPMCEQPQGKSLGLKGPGVTTVRLESR